MPRDNSRKEDKNDHKTDRKVDKLNAKANLSLAKAQKRKWLVILIGIGIAAYYALKGGGGGFLDIIKSKLGM
tara:strand:+ start:4688 stop:4903 length:216 start_codon:yes stop_codon:yes gene_type:complete